MYLNLEAIRSVTFGTLEVTEDADGFHFYRFTKKQLSVWEQASPTLARNAKALTGVTLDLETNSRCFSFEMSLCASIDLYLDGLLWRHISSTDHVSVADLDGANHRITVYLPAHGDAPVLRKVAFDDGASLKPHSFDRKILFVGDSITQGWESVHQGVHYDSLSYANIVSRRLNAEGVIQGVGGAYFLPDSVDRLPFDPDTVFVAYGTNDFTKFHNDYAQIGQNAAELLRRMGDLYQGRRLFCITPTWRDCKQDQQAFEQYCAQLKRTVKESRFALIEGDRLVPHLPDFFTDSLHPNAMGFSLYADALLKALEA